MSFAWMCNPQTVFFLANRDALILRRKKTRSGNWLLSFSSLGQQLCICKGLELGFKLYSTLHQCAIVVARLFAGEGWQIWTRFGRERHLTGARSFKSSGKQSDSQCMFWQINGVVVWNCSLHTMLSMMFDCGDRFWAVQITLENTYTDT